MSIQIRMLSIGVALLIALLLPSSRPCHPAEPARKAASVAFQPTRTEQLLPQDTVAFISVTDLPAVTKKWSRLGFRPFMANPAFWALFARLEDFLPKEWCHPKEFGWRGLLDLPAGEACIALAESDGGQPVPIFMLDCRCRREKAMKFFDRLGCGSTSEAASPKSGSVADTQVLDHKFLSYFIKDDLLVATTKGEVTKNILRSWPGKSTLVTSELYGAAMEQAGTSAERVKPDIRWFLRPVDFLEVRLTSRKIERPDATLHRDIVRKIGLDTVHGVGGACWLDNGRQAMLYRLGVYAPKRGAAAQTTLLIPKRELCCLRRNWKVAACGLA
jgi:hypothetical protein